MRKIRVMIVRYLGADGTPLMHECADLPSFMHCVCHMVIMQRDFSSEFVFEDQLVDLPTREEVLNEKR